MKKKKTLKRIGLIALISMLVLSGSAWLTSRQTANGVNKITAGKISIIFEDQRNVITLSDNTAIPMTLGYAKGNTPIYYFTLTNNGDCDLVYSIKAVVEDRNTIDPNLVNVIIVKEWAGMEEGIIGDVGSPVKLSNTTNVSGEKLSIGSSQKYRMIAYIDETAVNDDVLGKEIKFHLEVEAEQYRTATLSLERKSTPGFWIYGNFNDAGVTNNDVTSFTVNGVDIMSFDPSSDGYGFEFSGRKQRMGVTGANEFASAYGITDGTPVEIVTTVKGQTYRFNYNYNA